MEGGVFPLNTMLGTPSDSVMDLDFMDELLLEGCWLEANANGGSEFFPSTPPFDPSMIWPTLESDIPKTTTTQSQNDTIIEQERQISSFPDNLYISKLQEQNFESSSQKPIDVSNCSNQFGNFTVEGSELSRRWWIGPPKEKPGLESSVMERLIWALGYIKDSATDKDVLIQI